MIIPSKIYKNVNLDLYSLNTCASNSINKTYSKLPEETAKIVPRNTSFIEIVEMK